MCYSLSYSELHFIWLLGPLYPHPTPFCVATQGMLEHLVSLFPTSGVQVRLLKLLRVHKDKTWGVWQQQRQCRTLVGKGWFTFMGGRGLWGKERHKWRYGLLGPASIRVSDLDVWAGDGGHVSLISSCKLLILQIWDHIFIATDREHTLDGLDVYISCVRYWNLLSESSTYTCQLHEKKNNLIIGFLARKQSQSKSILQN